MSFQDFDENSFPPVQATIHTHKRGYMYYTLTSNEDAIKYHILFPLGWALTHSEDTGPEECETCRLTCTIGDIFIGYCGKCALQYPKYCRGLGIINNSGKELEGKTYVTKWDQDNLVEHVFVPYSEQEKANSAYNTYLKETTAEKLCNQLLDCIHNDTISHNPADLLYNDANVCDIMTSEMEQSQDNYCPLMTRSTAAGTLLWDTSNEKILSANVFNVTIPGEYFEKDDAFSAIEIAMQNGNISLRKTFQTEYFEKEKDDAFSAIENAIQNGFVTLRKT